MVTIFDIITSVLLFATVLLLLFRWLRNKGKARFVLWIAFVFLFVSSLFNLPEHILGTTRYDKIEVILGILFLPSIILAIYVNMVNIELAKRKISEQKFKIIFNRAFSLMGFLDKNGDILEANEKALKMVDVSNEQIVKVPFYKSKWWSHSVEEQNKLKEAIKKAQQGKTVRFETTHIDQKGRTRNIDFSITPIYLDMGKILNFIVEGRDITDLINVQQQLEHHRNNLEMLVREQTGELEAANEELKAINEELHNKNEIINKQNEELKVALAHLKDTQAQLVQVEKMASLGTLTAGVAHEINNPLNYIMGAYVGFENYFKEYGSQDETKTAFLLNSIKTGVDRASNIVQGLNQFSRDNSSLDEECNIHEILDNCLVMLNNQIKHKIHIVKHYTDKATVIDGNVGKLHQVFVNVFTNAIHAIKEKGQITITTENIEKGIVVEISDNGSGMDKEVLKQIMDPFFTTKPPGEGTGLGLAITYSIINEHKGNIHFTSEINKGTKVTIMLPHDKAKL